MLRTPTKIQREELEAVKAIFEDDLSDDHSGNVHLIARFPIGGTDEIVEIGFALPEGYPKDCGPNYVLRSYPPALEFCIDAVHRRISDSLEALFVPGKEILFECVESLRDILAEWDLQGYSSAAQGECDGDMTLEVESGPSLPLEERSAHTLEPSRKMGEQTPFERYEYDQESHNSEKRSGKKVSSSSSDAERIEIHTSASPLIVRKSVFVAHVARITSKSQVQVVMESILKNKKVGEARATHNIMAYRIHNPVTGTVIEDFDDDGETAAGGRLMQMLRAMKVVDTIVVVSRWYGGINLGPTRFKCINTVASNLLRLCASVKDLNN